MKIHLQLSPSMINNYNLISTIIILLWKALYHSFIHSGYFHIASSTRLQLRGAPDYSIDTVSELTRWNATGNCEWKTCPRSLRGCYSNIRTCYPPYGRHRTYHWAPTPHAAFYISERSKRL